MTTHTPGPWSFGQQDRDKITIYGDILRLSPLAYCAPRPCWDDEQVANARLIAAAPDLLAALCAVFADVADADTDSSLSPDVGLKVRSAIAKAKK